MLGTLLVGIVALNVVSLSLSASSGRSRMQIDELQRRELGAARADRRATLGEQGRGGGRSAGPRGTGPRGDHLPGRGNGDAARVAHMLATDSFLLAPSVPSSYPANGVSYSTPSSPTTSPPARRLLRRRARWLRPPPAVPPAARPAGPRRAAALRPDPGGLDRRRRALGAPGDAADRPPPRTPLLRLLPALLVRARPRRSGCRACRAAAARRGPQPAGDDGRPSPASAARSSTGTARCSPPPRTPRT